MSFSCDNKEYKFLNIENIINIILQNKLFEKKLNLTIIIAKKRMKKIKMKKRKKKKIKMKKIKIPSKLKKIN